MALGRGWREVEVLRWRVWAALIWHLGWVLCLTLVGRWSLTLACGIWNGVTPWRCAGVSGPGILSAAQLVVAQALGFGAQLMLMTPSVPQPLWLAGPPRSLAPHLSLFLASLAGRARGLARAGELAAGVVLLWASGCGTLVTLAGQWRSHGGCEGAVPGRARCA